MSRRHLAAAAETERLGAALALSCPWSDTDARCIFLHGPLGAGKTTVVRGLLRALGEHGAIHSPTYGLIESYSLARGEIVHVDLYRLQGEADAEALGLRDSCHGGVLLLIEWPERAPAALPKPDLMLTLAPEEDGRRCELTAGSPVGELWLAAVAASEAKG
jgi:tRNA threonylcarbamoyladenosine biosynthesis protein TsaE